MTTNSNNQEPLKTADPDVELIDEVLHGDIVFSDPVSETWEVRYVAGFTSDLATAYINDLSLSFVQDLTRSYDGDGLTYNTEGNDSLYNTEGNGLTFITHDGSEDDDDYMIDIPTPTE